LYISKDNDPEQEISSVSRPFDLGRKGFIIGEGAGFLILEELEHALARKAEIYCEIAGYSTVSKYFINIHSGDAYHLTKPEELGKGGYRAMSNSLLEAGIGPYDIDLVNCHATSTDVGDLSELNSIENLFGNNNFKDKDCFLNNIKDFNYAFSIEESSKDYNRLKQLAIVANKTQIGHLLGAAGAVETIMSIQAMQYGLIPDNFNTTDPISNRFQFRYNKNNNSKKLTYILKNSFAFGGVNSSLIIKRFPHHY